MQQPKSGNAAEVAMIQDAHGWADSQVLTLQRFVAAGL